MKKIYIDKNDTVAAIVEKIVSSADKEVVLYVPRFTKITDTPNNFRLLKREIDSMEKEVEIESVDDEVLAMAKSAGIGAKNPFFQKNKKSFSDIVTVAHEAHHKVHEKEEKKTDHGHKGKHHDIEEIEEEESGIAGPVSREIEFDEEDVIEKRDGRKKPIHSKISRLTKKISFKLGRVDEGDESDAPADTSSTFMETLRNSPLKFISISAVALGIVLVSAVILASAKITVELNKVPWDYSGTLYASTLIKEPYYANGQARVAGIILQKEKNITASYPATGTEDVNRKASGKITIYNAYSSSPQPLVKNTRFATPEGKIYRIAQGITVPGARIVNNKIVPSTLEVTVYADKPGPDYNIGPSTFRIPGFQGSPKYEGFYAESTGSMTGGLIGTIKVATAIDIVKAKEQNRKNLESALRTEMALSVPQEIKILNDAGSFVVTKETVAPEADASGNFTVTTFGTLRLFGFKESDLVQALKTRLAVENPPQFGDEDLAPDEIVLSSGSPQYSNPQPDFTNKIMTVSVTMKSVWAHAFDLEKFNAEALGKTAEELNDKLPNFPGVKAVDVSLWPFWVSSIPNNPKKVTVEVE